MFCLITRTEVNLKHSKKLYHMKYPKCPNRASSVNPFASAVALMIAACILLQTKQMQAQVINFDVPGAADTGQNFPTGNRFNVGTNYVGQGALSDPGNNYWNPILFNGTTSGALLSDGVTASPITFSMSGFNEYAGNNYGGLVTNGTPSALFTPFAYAGSSVTLSNVAPGAYNLFAYSQNGSDVDGATTFTVGGNTMTAAARTVQNITDFEQNTNYVEFVGISPVSGAIAITLGGAHDFNGIQLQTITTPTTPTSLSATAGSASVELSWTASAGSPGPITYNVGRSTVDLGPYTVVASSPTNSFTDSSLTDPSSPPVNGTTYYYVVYSVNSGVVTSPASSQASATPLGPSAPVVIATPGDNQVALSWTASTGADNNITYNVLRSGTNGGPYTAIETGQSGINFTDSSSTDPSSPPVNGTIYYYVVQALDDGTSPANSIQVSTTPPGAPASASGLNATPGNLQVGLSWTASATVSPGPITYNIGRSITNGGPYSIIARGLSATTYTDTSVGENTYYYVVSAYNDGVGPSAPTAQASATPTGPPLVYNFDVPGSVSLPGNYSGLGAYPDTAANTNWNPIVRGGTTAGAIASDGLTVTPITMTTPGLNTYGGNNYGGTPIGAERLFTPFAYTVTNPYSMTLSNVPTGNYDLFIYGINGSDVAEGNSTAFTVDGVTQHTLQTISPNNSSNFVEGASYVLFAGVSPTNGTITINVAASGVGGNPGEADFNGLQLTPYLIEPPVVRSQPQSEELFVGANATFAVAATGGGLSYQWYTTNSDGATLAIKALPGATNATLVVSNVSVANATNYYCVITNNNAGAYQATNTSVATLTIVAPSGSFQTGVTNLQPLHYYAFDDTGVPNPGPAVAFDYAGGDNGVYGINCQNGSSSIFGPLLSPDGYPGFASTNYAVLMQEGYEPNAVPINSPWFLSTNTVTITAWINPSVQPQFSGAVIAMCFGGGSDVESFFFNTNGSGDLSYTWNNDVATTAWDSGLQPPASMWSFVALVVTPTNATISMMNANGITNATFVHSHANASFAGTTIIGDNPSFLTTGVDTFQGDIDEVGVFNHALTQTQLGNLYANAKQAQVFVVPATITSIVLGGSPSVAGNSGAAYGSYHVMTSTNLTLPLANWTSVASGTFDNFGNFNVALPTSTDSTRFYSIKSQ
jgi:hypothetical protein